MQQDQQFLEYVIKALVDNPGDVKINRTVDEMGVLLTLEVGATDMGKIIGRQVILQKLSGHYLELSV
jgi:predicted RNA-binding protein YlqC (UPF0109 family)